MVKPLVAGAVVAGVVLATVVAFLFFNGGASAGSNDCERFATTYPSLGQPLGRQIGAEEAQYLGVSACKLLIELEDPEVSSGCGTLDLYFDISRWGGGDGPKPLLGCDTAKDESLYCGMLCDGLMSGYRGEGASTMCEMLDEFLGEALRDSGLDWDYSVEHSIFEGQDSCLISMGLDRDEEFSECGGIDLYISTSSMVLLDCTTDVETPDCEMLCSVMAYMFTA